MQEPESPKITIVTAPDFYMHGANSRILALGSVGFLQDIQQVINKFWPNEDIVLCLSDHQQQDQGWLAFNLPVSDVMFLEITEHTDAWELATLVDFSGDIYFVCENQEEIVVAAYLNLRHGRQMFKNTVEAVLSACARRT